MLTSMYTSTMISLYESAINMKKLGPFFPIMLFLKLVKLNGFMKKNIHESRRNIKYMIPNIIDPIDSGVL